MRPVQERDVISADRWVAPAALPLALRWDQGLLLLFPLPSRRLSLEAPEVTAGDRVPVCACCRIALDPADRRGRGYSIRGG